MATSTNDDSIRRQFALIQEMMDYITRHVRNDHGVTIARKLGQLSDAIVDMVDEQHRAIKQARAEERDDTLKQAMLVSLTRRN